MASLRHVLGFLAALSVILPAVGAADSGEFTVQKLALPDGRSTVSGPPLGLYGPEGGGLRALTIDAERAHVIIREQRIVRVTDDPLPSVDYVAHNDNRSYNLSPAKLRLVEGGGDGYYGFYFDHGAAEMTLDRTSSARLDARDRTVLGNAQPETGPATEKPIYGRVFTTPHIGVLTAGTVNLTGGVSVKLNGPDVLVGRGDNLTRVDTGEEAGGSDEPNTYVRRWMLIEFHNATLHLDTTDPLETLLPRAETRWDGTALLDRPQGTLVTDGETYVARGDPATLGGRFRATLTPVSTGEGQALRADVQGELRDTTLAVQPQSGLFAPFPGSDKTGLALLGAFVAVAVGGGVGAVLLARSRRLHGRRLDARLAALVEDAHAAADRGHPDAGLAHLDEALRLAPDRAHLRIDRGLLLMRLDRPEEAIAAFEEAAALDATGDADLLAASAASATGLDTATTEALLARALTRDPALATDAARDPHLAHLLGRPSVARALDAARRRLREGDA